MTEFDWTDYLAFAEHMFSDDADEATLRTCTIRAYYAAFHVARVHIRQHVDVPRMQTHRFVWRWFTAHPSGSLRRIGHLGLRLRQLRTEADYDPARARTFSNTREALKGAAEIVTTLTNPHS